MSQVGKRIAGTLIEDTKAPSQALCAWFQAELRSGRFDRALSAFVAQQTESLDLRMVQVLETSQDQLLCRIPCVLVDHESPHPFRSEVDFYFNPLTEEVLRR